MRNPNGDLVGKKLRKYRADTIAVAIKKNHAPNITIPSNSQHCHRNISVGEFAYSTSEAI